MILPWRDRHVTDDGPAISTSLTAAEAECLRTLATGKRVLEIGAAYGYSTVLMALVAEHITSIDPHTNLDSLAALRANLRAYGCQATTLVGTSQQRLPALKGTFDLVFIDGDHSHEAVLHDVKATQRLRAKDGILACHDYGEDTCDGVKTALDAIYPEGPRRLVDTLWLSA